MITEEKAAAIAERFCDEIVQSGMNFSELVSILMSIMRNFACSNFASKHAQIDAWKYVQDVSNMVLEEIQQGKFIDDEQTKEH
jgi:hypothetical protein